jgi:signal transduction histidine kinase
MGKLIASIAHELNNPLTTVSLRVELLLGQVLETDPKRRALEVIKQEVKRMGNLVANLLQFSRRGAPRIASTNVCEEIDKTLALGHYHMRNHRITTVREYTPDVPLLLADANSFGKCSSICSPTPATLCPKAVRWPSA